MAESGVRPWPEPRPTGEVNPSPASVAALAGRPDDNAIIMLNLLRYSADDGRKAYARYGAAAGPVVKAQGGGPAYVGSVLGSDSELSSDSPRSSETRWDTALLVRYPRRAAYLAMQTEPAYVGAIPDRTAGLSARLLYPFHNPGGPADDPFLVPDVGPDEALVVCLSNDSLGRENNAGENGTTVLSLVGDMPMVSDGEWATLTVLRFSSVEAANDNRPSSDTLWLVTQPQGRTR